MKYIVLMAINGNRRSYLADHEFRTTGNIASARRFTRDNLDEGLIAAIEYITATPWKYVEVEEETKQIVRRHHSPLG